MKTQVKWKSFLKTLLILITNTNVGSLEKLQKIVQRKAIDKILMIQMQRIRDNLISFTQGEKELIFKFLNNAESPNKNDINLKIEL